MASSAQIREYYDGHAQFVQGKVGVNIRHRSIIRRLRRAGLAQHHHVLEIGCGIGTLTGLLAERVLHGSVFAVDISARAVQMAEHRSKGNPRITFQVTDMSDFSSDRSFDFVVLPDVLEHIPEEGHSGLFATIAKHLAPDGVVCIHIPDPLSLDWLRMNRPDALQIVDQSLSIRVMVDRFATQGLVLDHYERYGLWTKEADYNWIVFKKPPTIITQTKLPYLRTVARELLLRIGVHL